MLAPILVSLAGLVPAMAEGGSSFVPGARDAVQESAPTPQVFELRAPPKEGRATKVVRELHASLSPAGTVKVVDGVEAKIDKDSARPRLVGEREAWEERTLAVATVDGAARSVHATRRFMELERTIARDAGAELRRRGVVSPLAGAVARVRRRDDGTWERAFEGEVEHDPSCLASVDAEPPLGDLLPAAPVALGERWELAPEAIARALRLDVQELLLPLPKGGEPVPPPRSEIPWRAAKWSGTASVSSADDKVVRIALRLVGEGAGQACDRLEHRARLVALVRLDGSGRGDARDHSRRRTGLRQAARLLHQPAAQGRAALFDLLRAGREGSPGAARTRLVHRQHEVRSRSLSLDAGQRDRKGPRRAALHRTSRSESPQAWFQGGASSRRLPSWDSARPPSASRSAWSRSHKRQVTCLWRWSSPSQ
jgi:hypothetical protein